MPKTVEHVQRFFSITQFLPMDQETNLLCLVFLAHGNLNAVTNEVAWNVLKNPHSMEQQPNRQAFLSLILCFRWFLQLLTGEIGSNVGVEANPFAEICSKDSHHTSTAACRLVGNVAFLSLTGSWKIKHKPKVCETTLEWQLKISTGSLFQND